MPDDQDDKSRMNREVHVRICGSREVKVLPATRPRVEASVHAPQWPSGYGTSSGTVGIGEGFHVYRMDWTADEFTFFVDGVKYATGTSVDSAFTFHQPKFMVLNMAVGGRVGDPPPDTPFPIDFIVDYIRVWS